LKGSSRQFEEGYISRSKQSLILVLTSLRSALPSTFVPSMATSSTDFQSILDAALDDYHKQTGIDLINHPVAEQLHNCRSPDDVAKLLLERESAFKDYRDKYRKLIDCLRPVVNIIHAFSAILGSTSGLVSNQFPY